PEEVPHAQAGVFEEPVLLQDLFPTLLEALGLDAPTPHQGQSLLPRLEGRPPVPRLQLYGPLLYGAPRWAARKGPWKLIHGDGTAAELYHLGADPSERHDLSTSRPEIVQSLLALDRRRRQTATDLRRSLLGAEAPPSSSRLTWKQLERLRSLGYAR
ncbi:MAG: hypothetical protein KDD47_12705, partial [Acidobacteria bacterium]|nr:hypothetical protein [Acidobacteriota bacterium]